MHWLQELRITRSIFLKISSGISITVFLVVFSLTRSLLFAQEAPDPEKRVLEQRVEKLEKALAAVQAQLAAIQGSATAVPPASTARETAPPATAAQVATPQTPAPAPNSGPPQVVQHQAPGTVPGSITPSSAGVFPSAVQVQTLGE